MFESGIIICVVRVKYRIAGILKGQVKATAVIMQNVINVSSINKYLNYCMEQKGSGKRKSELWKLIISLFNALSFLICCYYL
jgi:hypothetical protein